MPNVSTQPTEGIFSRPGSQSEEDTTQQVLECNKGDQKLTLNDERGKEWGEILGIYRKNKKNRPTDNIGEEQSVLEKQKRKEDSRRSQKLREERRSLKTAKVTRPSEASHNLL